MVVLINRRGRASIASCAVLTSLLALTPVIDQEDFKGLGRFQLIDSNWKVCSQSPSAGKRISTSAVVTLSSVKLSEKC